LKYILKNGDWVAQPDEEEERELKHILDGLDRKPRHIRKQFELAWNDIFMLMMIREVKDEYEFNKEVLPDLIIPKA
tara:strand:+ start:86 stop:313 length:228 start_codon:yes stop_codon:yes gene_type:complete